MPNPDQSLGIVDAATETSIRQLIQNGRSKTALESAKEAHKKYASPASESLLIAAYEARIKDLARQRLVKEAESLWDSVRQRYPSAAGHSMEAVLHPRTAVEEIAAILARSDASAEELAEANRRLMCEVYDLASIAEREEIPPDHAVRKAATALALAFASVTAGPVTAEALALPEVSRRSPLAPWKSLILAIHHFYQRDDDACERYLGTIPGESAPFRLADVLRDLMRAGAAKKDTPAVKVLRAAVATPRVELEKALAQLDDAFEADMDARILRSIRTAVQECQRSLPEALPRLRQRISARCEMMELAQEQVRAALGGPFPRDAYYQRLLARSLESSFDEFTMPTAAEAWIQFRNQGIKEGWFPDGGPEVAVLYLHVADLVRRSDLDSLMQTRRAANAAEAGAAAFFLYPQALYEAAAAADPTAETFLKWLAWGEQEADDDVEGIAQRWSHACPHDVRPLILMMNRLEERNALKKALHYLEKAEAADSVHPDVRSARFRLLLKTAVRHLQNSKLKLVSGDLEQMQALAESRQGDRPAMISCLRHVLALKGQEDPQPHRAEAERLLDGSVAAALALWSLATLSKVDLPPLEPGDLKEEARRLVPEAIARVGAMLTECGYGFHPPVRWLDVALASLVKHRPKLNAVQLGHLGDVALKQSHVELAYAASAAGLKLGGTTEARFLLLRGRAIPESQWHRRSRCMAAALRLASERQDTATIGEVHRCRFDGPREIDPQLFDLLRKSEREADQFPTRSRPGPDYRKHDRDFLERMEMDDEDPFDLDPYDVEEQIAMIEQIKPPPGIPKNLANLFLEAVKNAMHAGMTPEEFEKGFFGGMGGKKGKKGRF